MNGIATFGDGHRPGRRLLQRTIRRRPAAWPEGGTRGDLLPADDAMVEPWCKSRIVPVTAATAEASLPGSAGRQLQIAQAIQATRFEAIAEAATEVVAMMDAARPADNERFDPPQQKFLDSFQVV